MHNQSYFRKSEIAMSNISSSDTPLQVNCTGVVECQNCHTTFRRNDYYLLYMLNNRLNLHLPEHNFEATVSGGDFIIIEPNTDYEYCSYNGESINYLWLHFTGSEAENLLKFLSLPTNCIQHIGTRQQLLNAWKHLFSEFIKNDRLFEFATENLLREILMSLSRAVSESKTIHLLEKSVLYINEHYADELTVANLASLEDMSETHFRMLFKQQTGMSPIKYIADIRIQAAMTLLDTTNMDLAQIAEAVGYSDAYYFGRIFKQTVGTSPGKYRQNNNGRSRHSNL